MQQNQASGLRHLAGPARPAGRCILSTLVFLIILNLNVNKNKRELK
jgi:hypothetical protein